MQDQNLKLYLIYSGWVNFENNNKQFNSLNPNVVFLREAESFFSSLNIKFFNNSNDSLMKDVNSNRLKYIIENDHHPNKLGSEIIFNVVKDDVETILNY